MPKIKNWSRDKHEEVFDFDIRTWKHDNSPSFIAITDQYGVYNLYYGPNRDNQTRETFDTQEEAIDTATNMMRENPGGLRRSTSVSSYRPPKPRGKTPDRLQGRRPRDR